MQLMRWMFFLMVAGALLLGSGLYLLWFTPAATEWGIEGIGLIVTLITVGVCMLVPAKIYIILRYTRK
jgi:hypothetical protein